MQIDGEPGHTGAGSVGALGGSTLVSQHYMACVGVKWDFPQVGQTWPGSAPWAVPEGGLEGRGYLRRSIFGPFPWGRGLGVVCRGRVVRQSHEKKRRPFLRGRLVALPPLRFEFHADRGGILDLAVQPRRPGSPPRNQPSSSRLSSRP